MGRFFRKPLHYLTQNKEFLSEINWVISRRHPCLRVNTHRQENFFSQRFLLYSECQAESIPQK